MKNKFYKLIAFSLIFGGAGFTASAQLNCGATQATQKLYEQHPELAAVAAQYDTEIADLIQNAKVEQRSSTTVYVIPIVFHVLHQNGTENISDAQIFNQVDILNRDYRKLNADTATVVDAMKPFIADSYVEFRLAQIDPNGNCTNGIDRIYTHLTNSADDYSKLNQWPRDKYLNVWTVKTIGDAGVAGYAYYPSAVSGPLFPVDGVLILHDYIGSIGSSSVSHSRALTHEIGHYLNLQHTWGNTNDPNVACGDDQVTDTPPTKGHLSCTTTDRFAAACTFNPITTNYKFDTVTTTSGTTDPGTPSLVPGITLSHFTANGVGANSSINGEFSYDGWDTGAPDGTTNFASLTGTLNTSKYYEFTVTPNVTNSMTLNGLSFIVDRSATGPRTWAVRASTNAYASNIGTASITPANANLAVQTGNVFFLKFDTTDSQKGTKIALSGAAFTNIVAPVTFRIYGYNAEDAFGTFGIDSVYLSGTTGLVENTENYMDYSYCSKMYTIGQRDRLRAALESSMSSRSNLWSVTNLAATGVSSPQSCVPYPDFFADKLRVCKGDVVKFTKNVVHGTETARTWTFEGGTPATSTSATAVNVTYNTPGLYKVTLSASNAAGADSVIKVNYIRVDEDWADIDYNGAYTENFQNTTNFYWDWQVRNYDNNPYTWSVSDFAGYESSKCVMMTGYNNYNHDVDDLISPSYDLSYTSANIMTFKCAAASSAGAAVDVTDFLKVYVSTNCGNTWNLRATFKDSTLINNGYQPTYFAPGPATVWTERTVSIPASFATANVRFKFEYTTGAASNNIYIDDINLQGTVGITEDLIGEANLLIYPNPTNQTSTIAYHLNKKANTKIEVVDVLGKKVFSNATNGQAEGDYSVQISKQNQNLRNGIYFVRFSVDNESVTKKLIITE